MKNSFLNKIILLATLLFCQHLSFAQTDFFWQNSLNNILYGVEQNTTVLLTTSSGADCGCTTIGSFVNPNKGLPPEPNRTLRLQKGNINLL